MKKETIDGVVEAVHYSADGQVAYVRAYQRRGPTFSDVVLIQRDDLVKSIKSGSNYYTGERICGIGTEFKTFEKLQVVPTKAGEILLTSPEGSLENLGITPLL
jgi:hypothetical protein